MRYGNECLPYSQLSAILDFRKLDGVLASNNTLQSNFVSGLVALQKLVFILHNKNVDSEKYSRMAKILGHEIATEFVSRNFKKPFQVESLLTRMRSVVT